MALLGVGFASFWEGEFSGLKRQSTAPIRRRPDYTRKNDAPSVKQQGAEPAFRPSPIYLIGLINLPA
jgi:hypothetical protein